ncbi:unnamed protein product [Rhizoctonia solani]|uniref:3-oxoacyl-[acyl-carrier-protein] reductase FabG n=1 Tax=Rhizoctonia solani TaxID=456999 RepID=A0A8H3A9L9_9AGAM|nr:unnamed protein product [Rhizoctonia solani]
MDGSIPTPHLTRLNTPPTKTSFTKIKQRLEPWLELQSLQALLKVRDPSHGIGRAIALQLAQDGNDVGVNDISNKQTELEQLVKEIEQMGRKAISIPADVSTEPEVQAMVQNTVDALGGLDIMVANAGVLPTPTPILEVTDQDIDRTLSINCKGVLYCYRAAAVQMIKQGRGGQIIGASSSAGINDGPLSAAYCISKFAVRAITQTAALEWGQHNITVNAYAPGAIETPMVREITAAISPEELVQLYLAGACIKRPGQPEEVAAFVGFLASERASYITEVCTMAKVAIVTGAARGIGRAIALQLARDGVDIAVNDIPSKQAELEQLVKEIELMDRKAIPIPADVSKESEVQAMVQKAVDALGGLDIMVANAGIILGLTPILELTDEDFDRVMNINCKGTLYCYRAAAVQMIKQGRGGRIIGASSSTGINANALSGIYSISKFSIRAITQTAALEWGQHNITVNAYAPGVIETPMSREARTVAEGGAQELAQMLLAGACMKHPGQPEEVAALVGFLASTSASYITGGYLTAFEENVELTKALCFNNKGKP